MAGLNQIGPDLPAGLMRTRVTIQKPVKVAGRQTWKPLRTVWAFVDPSGGGETARQLDPVYQNSYDVQMRFQKDLHVKDRLQFAGPDGSTQTLEVQAMNDVQSRHITLDLTCKQMTS